MKKATKSNSKENKSKVTSPSKYWYLVTMKANTVALIQGLKNAKAVFDGGDQPIEKYEHFEEAYSEFKKRWRKVPNFNPEAEEEHSRDGWVFMFIPNGELLALVKGRNEGEKIFYNYKAIPRMVNANSYKHLLWEIKALRESKSPHEGILNPKYLVKPKANRTK